MRARFSIYQKFTNLIYESIKYNKKITTKCPFVIVTVTVKLKFQNIHNINFSKYKSNVHSPLDSNLICFKTTMKFINNIQFICIHLSQLMLNVNVSLFCRVYHILGHYVAAE